MWKYFSISDCDKINLHNAISLHDCYVTKIIADKDLMFEFSDGFWIVETNKQNPYGQTLRTDKSQIYFTEFDIDNIYIFKKFSILRRIIRTSRIEVSLEKLISNINSGKWQLEIIDEFHKGSNVLFNTSLYLENRSKHMECQIIIEYKKMNYFWNNICEDRPW